MAKKCRETYAKCIAKGYDWLDAMKQAGYKTDNLESAKRLKRDFDKDTALKARIQELIDYYAEKASEPNTVSKKLSPREYLESMFNNVEIDPKLRMQAATALLPYTEQKMAQTGKKEDAIDTAREKSENGRFSTLSNQLEMPMSEIKN